MIRVGQKLYEARIRKGLALSDIEKAIKIKSAFLSALEKGEYQKLPSGTYVYGFVRNYAEFLGLPKSEILALFRREFDEEKVFKVLPEGFSNSSFSPSRIKFVQAGFFIIFIFSLLLGYIAFQYRSAILNPQLEIITPKENQVFSSEVIISGKTDPNATLFINNVSVSLDEKGNFKKNIDLFPGKAIIAIKVVNRFGRETLIERHIEVKQ